MEYWGNKLYRSLSLYFHCHNREAQKPKREYGGPAKEIIGSHKPQHQTLRLSGRVFCPGGQNDKADERKCSLKSSAGRLSIKVAPIWL